MVEPVQSRRRLQAAATQEQLLAAARDVFQEKGYAATTVGAITTAASTAHGTFYLYFRNKEDAFLHVMEAVTSQLYAVGGAWIPGDPRSSLEASIRGFLEVFLVHRGLWRCVLEASFGNPTIEAMWLQTRGRFTRRVAQILEQQVASGAIRSLNPELTASSLGSMVEWEAVTQFVLKPGPVTEETFDECVATLTDIWYHAVYVSAGDRAVPQSAG
jgi:AcrR family transcriptional regulator